MTPKGAGQENCKDSISRAGYAFVALWAAGLLLLYAIGGYFGFERFKDTGPKQRSSGRPSSSPRQSNPVQRRPRSGYPRNLSKCGWGSISTELENWRQGGGLDGRL